METSKQLSQSIRSNIKKDILTKTFSINFIHAWSQYTLLYLAKLFGIDAKLLLLLLTLLI